MFKRGKPRDEALLNRWSATVSSGDRVTWAQTLVIFGVLVGGSVLVAAVVAVAWVYLFLVPVFDFPDPDSEALRWNMLAGPFLGFVTGGVFAAAISTGVAKGLWSACSEARRALFGIAASGPFVVLVPGAVILASAGGGKALLVSFLLAGLSFIAYVWTLNVLWILNVHRRLGGISLKAN